MSHYKPYPVYKDTGVEWLGRVPEHWEVSPLKYLISGIESGTSVNATDTPAGDGERGVLKTSCVYSGKFDPAENKAIVPEEYGRAACPLVVGSLIVSRMNTPDLVGAAGLVCQAPDGIFLPDRLWQVSFSGMIPTFSYYWSQSGSYRTQVKMVCTGTSSSMQNLSQDQFKDFVLGVPAEDEQQLIAAHLDRETVRIDALIEKKTRFIELLREKRQALITHTVTKGLDPNVKMKDSGLEWLGEVPEHWAVKRLKFIAVVQTGIAKGKDNAEKDTVVVPYLRVANVQDGYLDLDEVATIEVSTADLPRYLLQPGDVLMNEGGDFDKLGRGHVWHGEIEPCIHQNHVFAVRPHGVSSEWLNTFTSSAAAQFYFMGRSKQSTNLASISSSNLMELAVPLPSEEEQRLILDGLHHQASQVNALLAQTERSIELLKERRSALITAAVTGQIDLRESA
ncbi:restriction endonuclease subunit S [Pseudomonas aeruginosa]